MTSSKLKIGSMESNNELELLEKAELGDQEALGDLMQQYRPRLERVIRFRMDSRLRERLDAGDDS